ncbi:MAG: GntR family transcriptional regulator [Betaproteobacteria bacterium]|nr:GntR family transcriptional regulator [Betaproteobacteria bacterium]
MKSRLSSFHPAPPVNFSSSPTFSPLYRQIKNLIMEQLASGEWRPGDAIPSEADLALRFGVSQGTVRKAVDEMAMENLLVRRQGKGTFVATHDDPHSFFRFLRLAANEGKLPVSRSIPLECSRGCAGAEVAQMLGLKQGDPIVMMRRLLYFGDAPVVFDEIYLPGDLFQDLSLETLKESDKSLYSLFETRYGVRMIRADERLFAVRAEGIAAQQLNVEEDSPLLLVERVAFTYGDKPVEWRRGFYLTREHHYHNELN